MRKQIVKESGSTRDLSHVRQPVAVAAESVHAQPLSPCDDVQARIARRAYELHAARGYRHGYAVEDWIEAEREILAPDSCA